MAWAYSAGPDLRFAVVDEEGSLFVFRILSDPISGSITRYVDGSYSSYFLISMGRYLPSCDFPILNSTENEHISNLNTEIVCC